MTSIRRCLALLSLASAASALAQPTFERTACLHPQDQALGGEGLAIAAADLDDDGRDDIAWGAPYWDYPNLGETNHGVYRTYEWDSSDESGWRENDGVAGATGDLRGYALAAGDFDGDLLPEIAVASPFSGGGKVVVREPCGNGCADQLGIALLQGASGIAGSSEEGDQFGIALAAGDFDDDGFDDLAVGVPGEEWPGVAGEFQGAVHVFFGSEAGLDGARDLLFGQDSFSGQTREAGDHFGRSLAAGDLDGDGFADLAIGAPNENEGGIADSGIVHVVFGSSAGLDFTRRQNWSQSTSGIDSSPEADDLFGWRLAIGDFLRTGTSPLRRDLAISAACEADGEIVCAGAVHVLYSDANGPSASGSTFLLRPGGSVENGVFGNSLHAADLDHDKAHDLVVGAVGPAYEAPQGFAASGEVHLLYGQLNGAMRASGLAPWRPLSGACVDDGVAAYDFGESFATGDFDEDGLVDLAIGVPGWSHSVQDTHMGAVQILFGSWALFRDGFETADSGRWSATTP